MVSERSASESPTRNQRGAKHFRTLRDGAADGDSSGAGSLPRQVSRGSVFVFDQVFAAGEKIVYGVLLGPAFCPA